MTTVCHWTYRQRPGLLQQWAEVWPIKLFGHSNSRHIFHILTAFQGKITEHRKTVKHGGRNLWFGIALLSQGLDSLQSGESTIHSSSYWRVLDEKVRPSVQKLELNQKWFCEHYNNLKLTSKFTQEVSEQRISRLVWVPTSPCLAIDSLWVMSKWSLTN